MAKKTPKAEELATKQKEISVAEFFEKNRHLLGFDSPKKALMTAVKEAVDNALDACEEAEVLPEISLEIIDMGNGRFRMIIEDNGPGIVKRQIPKIFAKLLYGSKFHALRATRGQQGIGISAAALYGQLTTGRPIKITSKIDPNHPAIYNELHINTLTNQPEIVAEKEIDWKNKDHGTKIELDMEASYSKGMQSVDEYIKETAIINPHCTLIYTNPKAEQFIFARASEEVPKVPVEIKPHPYGVELGVLIRMMKSSPAKSLQQFLTTEFSRVSTNVAKEICDKAVVANNSKPGQLDRMVAEKLIKAIRDTKIIAPPTDCVQPIGAELLEKGLKKEVQAEFYCSTTRPASVYRGNPFVIECAIGYGGELTAEGTARVMRFANKVPLLYQQSAGAIQKAITDTNWRGYGLSQSSNSLPQGPLVIVVHMASVWVPFTSESKEAIANYDEINKEMKLALQDCGRKLGLYVRKKKRVGEELKKRGYMEKYIPHVAEALKELLDLKDDEKEKIEKDLAETLEHVRGEVEDLTFDPTKNKEYDETLAKFSEEDQEETEESMEDEYGKKRKPKKKSK
jgi:DNA topoisomerase VI subunit B